MSQSLVDRFSGEIHFGKADKEPSLAHFFYGLYFCKRLADHVLKKGKRALVHALIHRFRRYRQLLSPLRHFRRQLRERRVGITPDAEGDQGQKDFARNFRGASDKAGSACRGCNVFCGKEFC